jgi:hypothetical protein
MPATKGQTGSTLKINLTPYLLQVSFTSHVVSMGGFIGVEAHTLNVADEAKIEITFLDGTGANVGSMKGKVHSNVYRGLFHVEKANSTGHMLAVAELSDYGLKLAGPACKVYPPVKIENLKWMDEEGSKELETVVRGQKVTLTADVTLGPMDEEIVMSIKAQAASGGAAPAGDSSHGHSHQPQPVTFKYPGKIKSKKIKETFVADWETHSRKGQLDYTINLYGVTSKPSKKVKYLAASFDFSE